VIDLFAARNIPIRTIERASGLIATDNLTVGGEGVFWADCGRVKGLKAPVRKKGMPKHLGPNRAMYNLLVRGDSSASTVKATVRWSLFRTDLDVYECSTNHEWERKFEEAVKEQAERHYVAMRRVDVDPVSETTPPRPAAIPQEVPPNRETAASRRARKAEEARAKARLPRGNAELLLEQDFGVVVGDCMRLGLIAAYGETTRDTLVVDLTDEAMTSSRTEYYMARLFDGYLRTTGGSTSTIVELRHNGRKVGESTARGLSRSNWR
jgi:hypothetical protein